jgi:hypothetical protein
MVFAYMLILLFSAALASWTAVRITRRVESLTGMLPVPTGLFIVLSALGFMVIVAMPSRLMVGGLLLFAMGLAELRREPPLSARIGVPLIAILIGLSTFQLPSLHGIYSLGAWFCMASAWLAVTLSGHLLPDNARQGCGAIAMVLLPLAAAPLYTQVPSYLTLDCALLMAPLLGGVYAHRKGGHLGMLCRLPYAYLIGWLMLVALLHHAYISVILSATLWLLVYYYHANLRLRKFRHATHD